MSDTPQTSRTDTSISKEALENGTAFMPRFSADGLIVTVVTDATDDALLMVAHMNEEALRATLATGIAHYWSRSRKALWRKGESSGHEQTVVEMRTDCDQDVIQLRVKTGATGASCHTGRRSCFYRLVKADQSGANLVFDDSDQPRFDPDAVYQK